VIVDCHCHLGPGDRFRGPWNWSKPIEAHLTRARSAGIDRTVIFPFFSTDYADANARLAQAVRAYPDELIGFAGIDPMQDDSRAGAMIGRAVEVYGFRGIKVHGLESFPNRAVCDAARRYHLPMLVDVVRRLDVVEELASRYPDVNFIIPHLGGFADDWAVHMRLIDQLCRFENVFADSSGVRYWDALAVAVRRAGAHKILFGSDGPLLHPALELFKIRLLQLQPDEEQLIVGGNVLRLLGKGHARTPR
jgi:uncharacterized protein